ncbi:MAG TPA: GDP-mannose 4,6-dehydratase, partial [Sphingomonas sp.]|nr:GDP-mannose 4,6-dehydratase [Sphingomonas sp.]
MATLVTGAAGFIGYHLADRLLAAGERVIGVDNFVHYYLPQLKEDRVADLQRRHGDAFTLLRTDFADHAALDEALRPFSFERIAHLGAQPGVRYSIENPRAYAHSNLVGHLNMLEVARARGVPMVYASSSSVYGGNESLPFRVEDRVDR